MSKMTPNQLLYKFETNLWHYQMLITLNRSIAQRLSVRVNPRFRVASSKQFDELLIQSANYSGLDINFGLQIKL